MLDEEKELVLQAYKEFTGDWSNKAILLILTGNTSALSALCMNPSQGNA
jgi:hypothetical protein